MGRVGAALFRVIASTLLVAGALPAQELGRYSISLRDVSVEDALAQLVERTGIDLLYDADVVRGRSTVCRAEGVSAEDLLRCVVSGASLDYYRTSSGTYVVIAGPEGLPAAASLTGIVIDVRSGRPVPFAEIETAARTTRASADASGVFTIAGLAPGDIEVVATSLGYRPTRTRVSLSAGDTRRARILLVPSAIVLDPIVVSGLGARLSDDELGEAVWSDAEVGAPMSDGVLDAPHGSLGVSRAPLGSELRIQGSAAGEYIVRLDGVPVFEPVSLGGLRPAFSSLAVDRVRIHKAGFGVSEGSFVGGVVDIEQGAGVDAPISEVETRIGPYDVEGSVLLPLPGSGSPGSLLVAGRTSIWDLWREPVLDGLLQDWNQPDPVLARTLGPGVGALADGLEYDPHRHGSDLSFSDVHVRADVPLGAFRRIEASLYRGRNAVGTELFAAGRFPGSDTLDRAVLSVDRYDWSNVAGQIGLHTLVGDRGSVSLAARGSRYSLDQTYSYADVQPAEPSTVAADLAALERELRGALSTGAPGSDGNGITEWGASASADYSPGGGHLLAAGMDVAWTSSRVHLDDPYFRRLESSLRQTRFSGWLQDRVDLGTRWRIEGGLRATWLSGRDGEAFLEPRLAVRYDDPEAGYGGWSLRVATGVYHQFLHRYEVSRVGPSALVPAVQFWMPPDTSVAPMRSYHVSAEAVWRPTPDLEVRGEAYHKALDRILSLDYAALVLHDGAPIADVSQAEFIGTADGSATGFGVRFEHATEHARTRLAYDFTASERTFPSRFEGEAQPVPWLEPHRLTLGSELDLGAGFRVRAEGAGIWGRSWGLRRAYYDFLTLHDFGGPTVGLPESDRLPALLQVDVGAGWRGGVGGVRVDIGLEVRNVLDRDNVLDRSLQRTAAAEGDLYASVPRRLPGITPLLWVRLTP